MESTERRTDGDEHGHFRIEPRPASNHSDISDDDLSFSSAPRVTPPAIAVPVPTPPAPLPFTPREPLDDVRERAPAETLETTDDGSIIETFAEDDFDDEPLPPAIPKSEPVETFADLSEEEKNLEEADAARADQQAGGETEFSDERNADFDDEFSNTEAFAPRPRGGRTGGRDGGRGGDRGGRGRSDRDRRGGPGAGGGRSGGRPGGRDADRGGRSGPFVRPKPNIEDIFKRGQEVIVQVIKEGIGTKGPTLSTYISIAGRYLVLMPGLNRIGVSRKIESEETRRRLRDIMNQLRPPKGVGFIIRTAGQDRDANELQGDLAYLSRLWEVVVRRITKQKSPTEVYRESDMVTRTIRDIFAGDIDTIWVDERGAYEAAKEFMEAVMPKFADRIKFYDSTEPMFNKYGVESEIARIQQRKVPLPYGGSIVIDQTEALVAIDVNSGNFRASNNDAEETAYQMNLHAAKEIARQLRLRDLGGVIANDFIDMRDERHRRNVEKALRDAVERDRARTKILRISQFGIIEMTRQRIRPSLKRSAFQDCSHCRGTGHVKTCESVSIEVMRMLQSAVNRIHISRIDVRVHEEAAQFLLNRKRKQIVGLEDQGNKAVSIISAGNAVSPEFLEFVCYDNNGNEVKFAVVEEPPQRPQNRRRY
ncbi:MAG: Rne/Rng family ribonuclease [Gemmataceae bacterium]|nr:Rne/Rng family ribonuclease [Gemmataceae bacterium]